MAHEYVATVSWRRTGSAEEFAKGRYSRGHEWAFDGGIAVAASASPAVVPPPWAPENAVDPEEAFVAAIASCHMLTFVDFCRRDGILVDDKAKLDDLHHRAHDYCFIANSVKTEIAVEPA
jgi:organic hydroperoxide reductase OsmC/OhrA